MSESCSSLRGLKHLHRMGTLIVHISSKAENWNFVLKLRAMPPYLADPWKQCCGTEGCVPMLALLKQIEMQTLVRSIFQAPARFDSHPHVLVKDIEHHHMWGEPSRRLTEWICMQNVVDIEVAFISKSVRMRYPDTPLGRYWGLWLMAAIAPPKLTKHFPVRNKDASSVEIQGLSCVSEAVLL